MSSISSLTKAVSGLNAAQKGLQVTGHNIANTNTKGYTRQQLLQSDSSYLSVGTNGGYKMQVGLGVTCDEIRQIRDSLADKRLRTENSVLNYYQKLNTVTTDIEYMFDEPYGDTISDLLDTFWSQAQKLSTSPSGVEERKSFISTAKVLMSKINVVSNSLTDYQYKLDSDIESSVNRINEIIKGIRDCNEKIAMEKVTGENANDYRDERNLLLDELSSYGEVSYYEEADRRVTVSFEGHQVVSKSSFTQMQLKQTEEKSPFKSPVWEDSGSWVYNLDDRVISKDGNDTGSLKALLVARGNNVFSKDTDWDDVALNDGLSVDVEGNAYIIPKIQMQLNEFAVSLANLVNNSFNGTGIGEYEGQVGVKVFTQIETTGDWIIGNIQVNPDLLTGGGYNKLGTVGGDPTNEGDNSIIIKFLNEFNTSKTWYKGNKGSAPYEKNSTLKDFFSELVTDLGTQGSLFSAKAVEKNISVTNIENERQAMGGVSTDEEFSNMLKYQYAYNASARMITMLDGMLDTIINKM